MKKMRTNLHGAGGSVVLAMIYPKWHRFGSAGDAEDAYRGISEANMGHVTACDGM